MLKVKWIWHRPTLQATIFKHTSDPKKHFILKKTFRKRFVNDRLIIVINTKVSCLMTDICNIPGLSHDWSRQGVHGTTWSVKGLEMFVHVWVTPPTWPVCWISLPVLLHFLFHSTCVVALCTCVLFHFVALELILVWPNKDYIPKTPSSTTRKYNCCSVTFRISHIIIK